MFRFRYFRKTSQRCSLLSLTALLIGLFSLPQGAVAEDWSYTVRPGDSLWKIADTYLISPDYWRKVQELNGIGKTRQLSPGTRLTIPVEWLKQQPASASIVTFRGDIELIRKDKAGPLPSNNTLYAGDGIRTGKNSSINIKFSDGSQITVFPSSEIYLETLKAQEEERLTSTAIKIIRGRVVNHVTRQSKGSRYEVNTPAAVAAVRGTTFRIGADDGGEVMRSEVLTGAVGVSGSGVTQHVSAGYATIAKVGSPPIAPRRLPAAPDLSSLSRRTTAQSITYQWPMLTDINSYRAQLALDNTFSQIVSEKVVDAPRVTWDALTPATYFMQVRGIDELGLEGFSAQHTFSVDAPLQPPSLRTPRDGATLRNGQPFMAWSNVPDANFYLLQLASDADFSRDLEEVSGLVNNNFKPAAALAAGQHYWRVQSVSRHGEKSAFSAARSFTIEPADKP